MNSLADLADLQIPSAMAQSAQALRVKTDLGCVRGMTLWRRHGGGGMDYGRPSHHTLSIYQAGGYGVWSRDVRSYGFSDAICVLPEGLETRWTNSAFVSNLHIYFTQADLEAMGWDKVPDVEPVIFGRDPLLKSLAVPLVRHLDWDDAADALSIECVVTALLSRLSGPPKELAGSERFSAKTQARIDQRLNALESGPPSLSELAAEAGMSPRHFTRLHKASTGQTVSERFREVQMARASELLATSMPLAEIALACGFSSQSHFSTAYRRHFGQTPGQARRSGR